MSKISSRLSLKKLKNWTGREGPGFQYDLYIDGRRAADVLNSADGGPHRFWWDEKFPEAEKIFAELVKAMPPFPAEGKMPEVPYSDDMLAGALVDQVLNEKQYRRWCKAKVVFRLKGDKEGSWLTIPGSYTTTIRDQLRAQYGAKLEEILNDTYGTLVMTRPVPAGK